MRRTILAKLGNFDFICFKIRCSHGLLGHASARRFICTWRRRQRMQPGDLRHRRRAGAAPDPCSRASAAMLVAPDPRRWSFSVAGTLWMDVHCPGCGTSRAIDIRNIDRHPLASVGSPVLGLRCSWCSSGSPSRIKGSSRCRGRRPSPIGARSTNGPNSCVRKTCMQPTW
jgi:hypothetical protein